MKQSVKLKIVLACYAFYMLGGLLSAIFTETNNRIGSIVAIALPTCIGMICVTLLTQQVQHRKKKLPTQRNVRLVR
jgi:hypothetical protein